DDGHDLAGVTEIAQRVADNCRSLGVALGPCTVPQAGKPTFSLGDEEMEIGMGLHGEPGVSRTGLKPADAIADELLDTVLDDMSLERGARVGVLVNSLGATPVEELLILYRRIADRLDALGITIFNPLVGRYATSMEMTGASLTVLEFDDELAELYAAPADCAFWKV
ncbi:MAG: dihydroxyacetone kinase subunit DhaK, partial [Alphaproteobacteria bacterium]|nr:dihydroxyacetone kinase subunit DhaK [Alphaproteobacteria bacterium]